MKKKGLVIVFLIAAMALTTVFTSLAGEWKQDDKGWWYQEDDGFYPKSSEVWIDGNNDGMAECYYFDKEGYLIKTPFQRKSEFLGIKFTFIHSMNADGALMIDGVVVSRPTNLNVTVGQYSFVNETIKDIAGKDVAYVDSILGKANVRSSFYSLNGTYEKDYQTNNDIYKVSFLAGRCVEISCKTNNMFNLTKDNYTAQDIALELGLKLGLEGEGYEESNNIVLTESQNIQEFINIMDEESTYMLADTKTYDTYKVIYN